MRRVVGFVLFSLSSGLSSAQTTWYVDQAGVPPGSGTLNDPYTRIQFAIDRPTTLSGDTLRVAPGTYVGNIDFSGKSLRLWAPLGADQTVLDGAGSGSVVTIAQGEGAGTEIDGFTITGGAGQLFEGLPRGGGLFVDGSAVALRSCRIEGNTAESGAGLFANGSTVTATVCTVAANQIPLVYPADPERRGGGLYLRQGSYLSAFALTVEDNTTVCAHGGGIALDASAMDWTNGALQNNTVQLYDQMILGGGLWASSSIVNLESVAVLHNSATIGAWGGGLALLSCTGSIQLCTFEQNGAGFDVLNAQDYGGKGGAMHVLSSPALSVDSCTFSENRAGWYGGAVNTDGAAFTNCVFSESNAQFGGAVVGGTYTDCSFTNNEANSFSGGSHFGGAARWATLVDCTVRFNQALGAGGGISECTAIDCDVSDNIALSYSSLSFGGGAYDSVLVRCTVRNNQVFGYGGATTNEGGGVWGGSATQCLIYGNSAEQGGGAFETNLDRSTIFGNQASLGGGGFGAGSFGAYSIANTILWNNAPNEIATNGAAVTVSYSDVEDGYPGIGNFSADPAFWFAQDGDFHLQPGSACIDAGDPSIVDLDGTPIEVGRFAFDAAWCPAPTTHCVSTPSSGGCLPVIASTGTPSATGASSFEVDALNLPVAVTGTLFYGLSGPAELPFQGGTLCVATPLRRTTVQISRGFGGACKETFTFDFGALIQSGNDPLLVLGGIVNAQYWFRDSGAPTGVGLTNGLAFAICE